MNLKAIIFSSYAALVALSYPLNQVFAQILTDGTGSKPTLLSTLMSAITFILIFSLPLVAVIIPSMLIIIIIRKIRSKKIENNEK